MQLTGRNRRHVGVNRVCVSAAQKLEKGGAARPDGFERVENPRLRPSARVIDASPCPRITTQHNTTPPGCRDASWNQFGGASVHLWPPDSLLSTSERDVILDLVKGRHAHPRCSQLSPEDCLKFLPPQLSLRFHNALSQQMSVLLKLFKSRTMAEEGREGQWGGGAQAEPFAANLFHYHAFRQTHSHWLSEQCEDAGKGRLLPRAHSKFVSSPQVE